MKKAVITAIIAVVVLGGAAYGHHVQVAKQEKLTVQNQISLMQDQIANKDVNGANSELVKIMESKYPLTREQELNYRKQIDSINGAQSNSQSEEYQGEILNMNNVIKAYMNIDSIDDMKNISEASVNDTVFYKATEGAAPNGELINLSKEIKPIEIFKGIYGYKFSMRAINSKINDYFFISVDGNIYSWDQVINGAKDGQLVVNIKSSIDLKSPTDINNFVGEFGPNSENNRYKIWNIK